MFHGLCWMEVVNKLKPAADPLICVIHNMEEPWIRNRM